MIGSPFGTFPDQQNPPKVRRDQVPQSIAVLESKAQEFSGIAEHEQRIITERQLSEKGKLEHRGTIETVRA